MTSTRIDRPLGVFEKYQISKQITKAYGNVTLSAQLEHPPCVDFQAAFRPALARLIQAHPSLSVVVRDYDNSNVHFEQLTTIDLDALVHMSETKKFLELIREEVSNEFNLNANVPLWRITVMPINDTQCAIVFSAHHVICDGMSLAIFWKDFIRELNSETKTITNTQLSISEKKIAAPYELCNPPDVSIVYDVVPVVLKGLAPKILPASLIDYLDPIKNHGWEGDHAAVEGEAHNSQVQLICVSHDLWKPLTTEAKARQLSAHAVLFVAILVSWARLYPNQMTAANTPTNCRDMCNPPVSNHQMGNFVGNHTSTWTEKQLKNADFWSLVKLYGDDLKKNKVLAAKQTLLLKFLSDYPAAYCNFWYDKRKNAKLGREGGIEVSDLGKFAANSGNGDWKLQDMYFCQSAQTFASAFSVNSISRNDDLYVTLTWQKGALDDAKMDKFNDVFIQTLKSIPI